ncbi:MAG: cytochrome P450 [Gammaproteobacteria bacterium]|nr:cytochrome P450 [Gammaproteobacteria bacterium]
MSEAQPEVTLFDHDTLVDPYAAYKTLRDQSPVHFEPNFGAYIVTRYDLIREAIRDTATYSSEFGDFLDGARKILFQQAPPDVQQKLVEVNEQMIPLPPTMLTLDEPAHTKYRSLVAKLFTGSEVRKSEPTVREVVERNIEGMAAVPESDGELAADFMSTDFMSAFAFPVPLRIIADRLGIPAAERAFFDEAATAAASGLRLSPLTPEQMLHRAQLALDLQNLLVSLVEARRREPAEDMITILANSRLEDEDRLLTHGEALSILNQFLVAGHETTSSAFGWGMLLLCRNPGLQAEIRGDAGRIRTFVEEALRMEAPVQGLPRLVTRDTELGGVPLAAGSLIMLRFGAANRDERQFEDPDQVRIDRKKAGMQLAFGSGVHHCIGAPLARQELNLGFAALLERFEDFRLADGADPEAEPSFILRNLPTLPVCYRPRRASST